ncbi:MAG: TAXI family TRAP transporter solute-binding subunit [Deltaproteobacteria bacterium]|nr:TAXI family TRAP transporter solute-binding subunit [Deltaproteobacteria bacterium]
MKTIQRFATLTSIAILTVLLLLAAPGSSAARTKYISIGTGGTGGVYYPYGGGLAEIWTKHVKGVKAIAEVTGASVENTRLADRGETVIGEIMGDVAYQAYYGEGKFRGKPQKIKAMFMMYPNVYHVVTLADKKINSIQDLKGQRVSVGAPGSGTEFMTNLVLKSLGLTYSDFKVSRLSFVETANALKDHSIDVGIWCVAAPTSSIMDLATTHKIKIISFTPEEMKRITDAYGFYSPYVLPAGTYNNISKDILTPSVWNVVICSANLDEDLVYQLTKATFENQDYLIKIHPFAKHTTPQNAIEHAIIPYHPGAVKYFEEIGIKVPKKLGGTK